MAAEGPLLNAASVYVAVIVRTHDKEKIVVVPADGGIREGPIDCEDVSGKVALRLGYGRIFAGGERGEKRGRGGG